MTAGGQATAAARLGVLLDGTIYGMQPRGGVSRYVSDLVTQLAARDELEVMLHVPRRLLQPPPAARNVTVCRDADFKPWRVAERYNSWRLRGRCRRRRIRVFHSLFYTPSPIGPAGVVLTVYDMLHERHPEWLPDPETTARKAAAIRAADLIVTISNQTRDDLVGLAGIPAERVRVIYPGVNPVFAEPVCAGDPAAVCRRLGLEGPFWLHVGPRGFYKNFGTLLRAFLEVARRGDGFLVLVGGEPSLAPAEADAASKAGCAGRILRLPFVDDRELCGLYSAAAGLASCSRGEGFGLPLLEAMTAGCPVIASDIPVFREVLGDAGLFADPLDSAAVARRLAESLDPQVRRDCIAAGRARSPQFTWERTMTGYVNAYRSVLHGT